jgi:uncharacterized protein YdbL (DUF1318 family)
MLKRVALLLAWFVSSCVTVNIYFPAAAVERAADEIVKETWGSRTESAPKEAPRSQVPTATGRLVSLAFTDEAFAQEADINVSNPAIRALKDSIKNRSGSIKPFMDRGNVGITKDGLLTVRTTDGLTLKERAEVQQLVDAENRDRESLYLEIAKANNFPQSSVAKIKSIFARSWIEQAQAGWWIQDERGNWKTK